MVDELPPSAGDERSRVSAALLDRFSDHYEAVREDCFRSAQTARLVGPLGTCAAAIREHGFVYRATLLGLVAVVGEESDRIRAEMDGGAGGKRERPAVRRGDTTAREARLDGLERLTSILVTVAETPTAPQVRADGRPHGAPGRASRCLRRERRRLAELIDRESPLTLRDLPERIDTLCEQLDAVGPVDDTLVQAVHRGAASGVRQVAGDDADCAEALGRVLTHVAPLHHPGFPSY